MNKYKEYKISKSSFIGGWYMPESICDELIKTYNDNKNKWVVGQVGQGITDSAVKKSTEFIIQSNEYQLYLKNYFYHLGNVLEKYKKKYPYCSSGVFPWSIFSTVKIQHYKSGEGFKAWHCENEGNGDHKLRHLVFMTYLNTAKDAGTEFYHQGLKTSCQKGLTLIWPSAWTHLHRGIISETQEKTIITGWYDFNV